MKKIKMFSFFIWIIIWDTIPLVNLNAQSTLSQYSGAHYIGKNYVTTLDTAKLCIIYSLNYMSDSLKPQQIFKDRKVLLIGEQLNHFYSYYEWLADSAMTADFDKNKSSGDPKFPAGVRREGGQIYTYPAIKERTVIESITNLSTYRYKETVEKLQWILSTDTCTILSYPCLKATTNFRGRDWIVWFTMEVPVNAGPWKLCGLPGLIMKASDSRGHYVFECMGIEQLTTKKERIIIRNANYIDCKRLEYVKAQKRFYESYVNTLLEMGITVVIMDNNGKELETLSTPNTKYEEQGAYWMKSVNIADQNRKIPYNPIELE